MSKNYCIHPLIELNITPNYVTPCCMSFLDSSEAKDLRWTTVVAGSIWNSEKWIEYRKKIARDDYSGCSKCPYYQNRDYEFETDDTLRGRYSFAEEVIAFRNGDYTKLSTPKVVELSYDVSCNLACETCRPEVTRCNPAVLVPISNSIAGVVSAADELIIGGDGEIALSSTYQKALIESVAPKVSFMSNGTLLNERFWEKIPEDVIRRITKVVISVDGTTKEVYGSIRRYGDFDALCENLELLHVLKDRYGFRTKMAYTISRFNMDDCHNAVDFARRFGFSELFMSVARQWVRPLPKKYSDYDGCWVSSDSLIPSERLDEMREYARKYTGPLDKW